MPTLCNRCGQPIAGWGRSSNDKPILLDADGSNHLAACAGRRRSATGAPARLIAPRRMRGPDVTHVYAAGNPTLPPPWAAELGPFRDFTAEEIAAGIGVPVSSRAVASSDA